VATEMIAEFPRAESHTLRAEEERLRRHLEEQLRVRTHFAPLADVRAMLVSAERDDRPKSLVVSSSASVAERIYLYVHVAAHIALGHHLPLVTIVEGAPGVGRSETSRHREAEELARAIWWGQTDKGGLLGAPVLVQRSATLRALLAGRFTRRVTRRLLLAMRRAYYDLRIERALAGSRMAAWLREALCLTAVVCVAPQLSD
jgi:hypothetical protein